MVTKENIIAYIKKIPPTPKVVQETIKLLRAGELRQASLVAKEDPALSSYLRDLVNKPIYGFSKEVTDVTQIFSILGVPGSLQAVYNYLLDLLSPDKWVYFRLNSKLFHDFQAELSVSWGKILKHLEINDKQIEAAIALVPASVIVCEALFYEHKKDVELILQNKDIDLNTMIYKLTKYSLFDICAMIVNRWELGENIANIIRTSSGKYACKNKKIVYLAKWIHLLLFYITSKPEFVNTGLNEYLEFNIEFVEDIYAEFSEVMGIEG